MGNPAKGWTPERRKRQGGAIKQWKPWAKSTGPKSPECGGQVISDSEIGFFDVDSRSKALGDKFPSFECSRMLL